jgi:hypothetical protein
MVVAWVVLKKAVCLPTLGYLQATLAGHGVLVSAPWSTSLQVALAAPRVGHVQQQLWKAAREAHAGVTGMQLPLALACPMPMHTLQSTTPHGAVFKRSVAFH